ncbi:MAG: hypothetical protein RI894_1867 [Bacteroidota bacterium]
MQIVQTAPSPRIATIDLLKGLAMIIMALDHVRDFFHADSFLFDPNDIEKTNLPLFLTRLITNICAPAFCLLAGTSAFFVGKRKTKAELSQFLATRGLWLLFVEFTVVTFGWYFNPHFSVLSFGVIGSLGCSMLCLSVLVQLPLPFILAIGASLIFGHNLLDSIHFKNNIPWDLLHDVETVPLGSVKLEIYYPIIPWIGTMATGYCLGALYSTEVEAALRKKILHILGISCLMLFFVLRATNFYGDPIPWQHYDVVNEAFISTKTLMSFFNMQKYPPSLLFLLSALGFVFIFLANTETWQAKDTYRSKIAAFCCTFGRVPFFYYIVHLYLIHLSAVIVAGLSGAGWSIFILSAWITEVPALKHFGFSLFAVYSLWLSLIILMYPLCKRFDAYKSSHKEKWYLSYL